MFERFTHDARAQQGDHGDADGRHTTGSARALDGATNRPLLQLHFFSLSSPRRRLACYGRVN